MLLLVRDMSRENKPYRPHTPLLFVLVGVTIVVAVFSVVAQTFEIESSLRLVQPIIATALVAAVGGTRIFVR